MVSIIVVILLILVIVEGILINRLIKRYGSVLKYATYLEELCKFRKKDWDMQ